VKCGYEAGDRQSPELHPQKRKRNMPNERRLKMAANVETMFSVREKPWHGLGTIVMEAPTSEEALKLAGLDWNVVQEPIFTDSNEKISG